MDRTDRTIKTILFIVISAFLYLFTDSIGRWFYPAESTLPGIWLATIWAICLTCGAALFYGLDRIDKPAGKWTFAIVFYAVLIILLKVCGFYSYGGQYFIGYKTATSLMPLLCILVIKYVPVFFKWYGRSIKKLFKLTSVKNAAFLISLLLPFIVVIFVFIGSYKLSGALVGMTNDIQQMADEGEINHNTDHREPVRQYDRIFNDLNDTQLTAARKNGLSKPIKADAAATDGRLQLIEGNRYYEVDKLTHSLPYLVPKAAQLVEDMGRAFQDSLFNRGYSRNHKFTVTSVLRTEESVKSLQKVNGNSTTNSCHCYGTTVDISYFTFQTPGHGKVAEVEKMRQVLMQVVYDMRNQGRCYVKYEKKQTCLHITVR